MSMQENPKLIDDTFEVTKERFLYQSFDKEGKRLVAALTEEACIRATRFYLKGIQDGWPEPEKKFSGTVGGKL